MQKQVYMDDRGIKHRLKEKTLAEENLEKLEKVVEN